MSKTTDSTERMDKTLDGLRLSRKDPLASARIFLDREHTLDGVRTLHYHRGAFYGWSGACYRETSTDSIRNTIMPAAVVVSICSDSDTRSTRAL